MPRPWAFAAVLLLSWALAPASSAAEPSAADVAAVRRLLNDPSPSARAAAARRLAGSADSAALAVLVECLADPHPYVRRASAGVLGLVPDPAARARLARDAPRWKSEPARSAACQAFALWLDDIGRRALLDALADPVAAVRAEAVRWLADDRDPAVREALRKRVADPDPLVRAEALDALVLAPEPGAPLLGSLPVGPLLTDADPRVRLSALEAAASRGGEDGTQALLRALGDESWSVRLVAAELAGQVRDKRMLPALIALLRDARARVVDAAGKSLTALTGIPFDAEPGPWTAWLEVEGKDFDPATAPPPPPERARPPLHTDDSRTVQGTRFLDLPIRSRHVAFVLDCSHSMGELLPSGRTRWAEVVLELERALKSMTGVTANLCVFSDEVTPVFPRAVPLEAARREDVLRLARGRQPRGWTALYDAIAWGLADPQVDTVVVLSDGAPTAGSYFTKTDFFAELRRANRWRRARIDVIAVGSNGVAHRWRDTLQRLAEETGGTCLAR